MEIVVGIDPGVTTGVVAVCATPSPNVVVGDVYASGSFRRLLDLAAWLKHLHADPTLSIQAVVVERFVGSGYRTTANTTTIEVVGATKFWVAWHQLKLIEHTPAKRRSLIDFAIKRLPKVSGEHRHQKDALAHVLRYLVDTDQWDWQKEDSGYE